jgi:pyruvate kinase
MVMLYRHCFSTLLWNVPLGRSKKKNQVGLKLNGTHLLLVYDGGVSLSVENINTIKKNKEALIDTTKEVHLKVNKKGTKYTSKSRGQNDDS